MRQDGTTGRRVNRIVVRISHNCLDIGWLTVAPNCYRYGERLMDCIGNRFMDKRFANFGKRQRQLHRKCNG